MTRPKTPGAADLAASATELFQCATQECGLETFRIEWLPSANECVLMIDPLEWYDRYPDRGDVQRISLEWIQHTEATFGKVEKMNYTALESYRCAALL